MYKGTNLLNRKVKVSMKGKEVVNFIKNRNFECDKIWPNGMKFTKILSYAVLDSKHSS